MQHPQRRRSIPKALATAALAGATALTLSLPGPIAYADPPAPGQPTPAPVEGQAPPPADPNAVPGETTPQPPPPEPGRVDNAAGGLSYVIPAGWKISDSTQPLSYGQALLTKIPEGNAEAPTDTSVLIGRLDLKLFAGAETDNTKAATRLASDMGEFFMPFAGTRINQDGGALNAAGMPGAFSAYEVKFTDATKPNGQIWAGVVGETPAPGTPRGQRTPERWFVVWLGSATHPVDKGAATILAQSIRPFTPPPPPEPDPNAPPPANTNPGVPPGVGVPTPVTNAPPEMLPPG